MDRLLGFNAVEAALEAGKRTVDRIWVEDGAGRGRVAKLIALARSHGVPVERVDRMRLERHADGAARSAHQGVVAAVSAVGYDDIDEILDSAGAQALLLVADGVEDPRNLGALIRTAAGAGALAIAIPERRAAGLGATAARAAAGAVDRLPVCRVGNVVTLLKNLKERGFWTMGLDADAANSWDSTRYPARVALVVGGEGKGLRPLVRQTCDELISLPLGGGVESLNVSVAAGICLYEVIRQRRAGASKVIIGQD